jgi:hypothetical protein
MEDLEKMKIHKKMKTAMSKITKQLLLFFATGLSVSLFAQTGGDQVGNVEIRIREAYQAQVKEAVKLFEQPSFEDTTARKIPVRLGIRSQAAETRFDPDPIKPVLISGSRLQRLPRHMVRVGMGMYYTPLAEIFTGNDRSKTFNWGAHFRHFSTQTGVSDLAYDRNTLSETGLNLYGKRLFRNYKLQFDLEGGWNRYSYYGLPSAWIPEGADLELILPIQRYNTLAPGVSFSSTKEQSGVFRHAGLQYRLVADAYNTRENHIGFTSDWLLPVKDVNVDVRFALEHVNTNFVDSGVQFQFTQIQLFPKIKTQYEKLFFELGLNLNLNPRRTQFGDSVHSKTQFFLAPQVTLNVDLVPGVLSVYGGLTGDMQNQNMWVLSRMNPFIDPIFGLNPRNTLRFYGGLQGLLAGNVHFNMQGYFHNIRDMAIFARTPDSVAVWMTQPGFSVLYDDLSVTGFRGELTYDNSEGLRISAHTNFRSFRTSSLDAAFHMPGVLMGMEFSYLWRQKIQGNLNITHIGAREGFRQADNPSISSTVEGFWDVRLGATYHYNDQLSAFFNFTNLISFDYELYLGYRTQRVMAMMGFTYRL